jgi:hypothetical protein
MRQAITSKHSFVDIRRGRDGLDIKAGGPPGLVLGVGALFDIGPIFAPTLQPWAAVVFGSLVSAALLWFAFPWFDGRRATRGAGMNDFRFRRRGQTSSVKTRGLVASAFAMIAVVGVQFWLYPAARVWFAASIVAVLLLGVAVIWKRRASAANL